MIRVISQEINEFVVLVILVVVLASGSGGSGKIVVMVVVVVIVTVAVVLLVVVETVAVMVVVGVGVVVVGSSSPESLSCKKHHLPDDQTVTQVQDSTSRSYSTLSFSNSLWLNKSLLPGSNVAVKSDSHRGFFRARSFAFFFHTRLFPLEREGLSCQVPKALEPLSHPFVCKGTSYILSYVGPEPSGTVPDRSWSPILNVTKDSKE